MADRIQHSRAAAAAAAALACLALAGCGGPALSSANTQPPAEVAHTAGHSLPRITLSSEAAQRIGLRTDVVREIDVNGRQQKVVPYAAVLYDATGATFAYSNPDHLVFVRVPLAVDHIDGDLAVLSDGPAAGTAVVAVGATELLGTEFAVGE